MTLQPSTVETVLPNPPNSIGTIPQRLQSHYQVCCTGSTSSATLASPRVLQFAHFASAMECFPNRERSFMLGSCAQWTLASHSHPLVRICVAPQCASENAFCLHGNQVQIQHLACCEDESSSVGAQPTADTAKINHRRRFCCGCRLR